jgi:hypothetical protein
VKKVVGAALLAAVGVACGMGAAAEEGALLADDGGALRFIVFGDTPYSEEEREALRDLSADLAARAEKPAFAIHYGDTKAGGKRCTLARLTAHQDLIFGLIDGPVFFTPGDNDWTDCDRQGDEELEMLDHRLIPLYFSDDKLPETRFDLRGWDVARQPRFVENARWRTGGVQFGLLHIVATGNGREEIKLGSPDAALDRVDARDAANLEWLADIFAAASDAEALVLAIHADMTKADDSLPSCSAELRTDCHPYRHFEEALRAQAARFGKPVLLVHGDTNPYCRQAAYLGVPQMTRLNAAGDYYPGITEVAFTNGSFSFTHLGEGDAPDSVCPAKGE